MTPDAALAAARDHAHAGRFADAERVLRNALVGQATRADALSDLAMYVGQQGRLAESESLLAQSVALDPGYIPARLNLAVALARQGNLAGAADVLRQARAVLPPDDVTWWRRLAQLHARLGQPEDGLSAVAAALAIDPNDAEALGVRASLLLLAGDLPRGWSAYEARWRIGPRVRPPRLVRRRPRHGRPPRRADRGLR